MFQRFILFIIFLILIFGIVNTLNGINLSLAKENNFFYVGDTGVGNYSDIQDAIDNSSNDDTIYVYGGTYNENLVINKSINIIGLDKNSTIIKGNNSLYIILIKSSYVNISGFTLQNGKIGIYISGVNYSLNNIYDNIITENWEGIRFYKSSNNKIINNDITNNNNIGIALEESKNNLIKTNKFFENNKAIVLNRWSDGNMFHDNNLTDNYIGISLYSSFKNFIEKNLIVNCTIGAYLSYSTNNTIIENIIEFNEKYGIYLIESNDNEVYTNFFSNNYQDIKIGPEPPKIKAPGFDLAIFVFSLLFLLVLRKKIK